MSAAEMIMTDSTDEFGPGPPIESLRWLGAEDDPAGRTWHRPDDAAVRELREKLRANSGMTGLELVDPKEEGFAKKAAKLFLRVGFVAVLDVLDPARLEVCRSGCMKVVRRILATDPTGMRMRQSHQQRAAGIPAADTLAITSGGGNGHPSYVHSSHRYSITGEGAVIGNMAATPEFAYFCDPPVLSEVLTEIYGSSDYICNGFGGDFCLPGCVAYQPLHSDSTHPSNTHPNSPRVSPPSLAPSLAPSVPRGFGHTRPPTPRHPAIPLMSIWH
jgi:hypothetical protein